MPVPVLTLEQARARLARLGHPSVPGLGVVGSMSLTGPAGQVLVCDYSRLPGYAVGLAIAVYDRAGGLLDRFNTARAPVGGSP